MAKEKTLIETRQEYRAAIRKALIEAKSSLENLGIDVLAGAFNRLAGELPPMPEPYDPMSAELRSGAYSTLTATAAHLQGAISAIDNDLKLADWHEQHDKQPASSPDPAPLPTGV